MENIVDTIFLGGSKTIGHLPEEFIDRLDYHISEGKKFIIGDAHGADLAIQNYLSSKDYKNVTVYCSGDKCRFNVGGWEEKYIAVADEIEEYEFYRAKDVAMTEACDMGLVIWDGVSRGTKNNIRALKRTWKAVIAYRTDIEDFRCIRGRLPKDREGLAPRFPSEEKRRKALLIFLDLFGFRARYGDLCASLNEEMLANPDFADDVLDMMTALPDIQARILLDRFDKPRKDFAKDLGISLKRLEELECKAWCKIRHPRYTKKLTIYAEKYRKLEEQI